jgi:hypothetical protein
VKIQPQWVVTPGKQTNKLLYKRVILTAQGRMVTDLNQYQNIPEVPFKITTNTYKHENLEETIKSHE